MAASISARPLLARWPGKKPRLPTIIPKVTGRGLTSIIRLFPFPWQELKSIDAAHYDQQGTPPDAGVQFRQYHGVRGRALQQCRSQDQDSVSQQQGANEKPDRNHPLTFHDA